MRSFTLLSRRQCLWLATAVLALGGCVLYTWWGNPEVGFFAGIARKKVLWAQRLSREHPQKYVFVGGSSCAFALDGEHLLRRHGLPVANLGLGAGIGPKALTRFGLSQAKTGDTLVVALEPDLLQSMRHPSLGVQFCLVMGRPDWLDELAGGGRYSRVSAWLALRPGGYHFFTLLGKLMAGRPLFRYQASDVSESGWQQTAVRLPFVAIARPDPELPREAREWLAQLRDHCAQQGIRLVYALPWGYVPQDRADVWRQANARFLLAISAYMPVLKDPRLGVYSVEENFADTSWHLNGPGAHLRTDEMAAQIKAWQCWTDQELRDAANPASTSAAEGAGNLTSRRAADTRFAP